MEAVHLIVTERVINLPVTQKGELLGLPRDKDPLLEVANAIIGEEP